MCNAYRACIFGQSIREIRIEPEMSINHIGHGGALSFSQPAGQLLCVCMSQQPIQAR